MELINDAYGGKDAARRMYLSDRGYVLDLANATNVAQSLAFPPFHRNGARIAGWNSLFIDGHVAWVQEIHARVRLRVTSSSGYQHEFVDFCN